ncbi:hypothetical protein [Spiroplasma turonicum]|uniref:Transmembrane protein n=1 Tax=Spiroplasma turonicum TaxID=216946 RepID=A0A0K1P508_9MOLU|nr:hypothetical protein [Spiroplasma turonicum]AKU79363.1 hypothetical protein STURON_00117 [Spiroplasma turonicum]ALX70384.1 hypothetical protein STURO_v1c01150 [Spiroplasma turonicum]
MRPNNLCKAGCITSIVLSAVTIVSGLILSVVLLTASLNFTPDSNNVGADVFAYTVLKVLIIGIIIFIMVIVCFQIPTIIASAKVLRGTAKGKTAAGVLSIIFSGIVGGVLILCGKYEETNMTDENL